MAFDIFEYNIPEVRIVDFKLIVWVLTDESLFRESARSIDHGVFGNSGVTFDDFINVLIEKLFGFFILILLSIVQKSENTFFQENFHLSLT